jgi:hypothetical protein
MSTISEPQPQQVSFFLVVSTQAPPGPHSLMVPSLSVKTRNLEHRNLEHRNLERLDPDGVVRYPGAPLVGLRPKGAYMTWSYFRYRWDRMQSVDIGLNQLEIKRLQEDILSLERVLVYLLSKVTLEEKLTLDDPVVRDFLRLDKAENPEAALREIAGNVKHAHDPKLVKCPKCGSAVRDIADVHDEMCQWCGHRLTTEY